MVKQTALIFIIFIICIIFISASYLHSHSQVQPPVEPTTSPAISVTPVLTVTPTPIPGPVTVKTIQWADHTWDVTDYTGNEFNSDQVWVDSSGRLHMKLIYDGQWHDFNLIQRDAARYGTYIWTVATDIDYIQDIQDGGNPYFVFSPFLFDNSIPQLNYGEIDIEMCRWGRIDQPSNTDWTIHSANHLVHGNHFVGADNTYTLEWTPDRIKFTVEGPGQPYTEYVFSDRSGIPPDTGNMKNIVHIGQYNDVAPPGDLARYEAEVVLTGYTFTPMGSPTPAPTPVSAVTHAAIPVKVIQWAGHTWNVTDYTDQVFTSNNVWVDGNDRLHMKLIYDGLWHSFNLVQQDKAGYGTYKWTVASDIDSILDEQGGDNPGFVFSPFLFDSSNKHELDIQMTGWGVPGLGSNTNWTAASAEYQSQANNFVGANNTYTLEWMPDRIKFSVEGPSQPYREWVITNASKIPPDTGSMKSILMIGQYEKSEPPAGTAYYESEVVVSNYQYNPYAPDK